MRLFGLGLPSCVGNDILVFARLVYFALITYVCVCMLGFGRAYLCVYIVP